MQDGPLPEVPVPGEIIASKYRVERVLGVGGMGVVVLAQHVQLGQRVAIKFMRREAALVGNAIGRFVREARAAVALSNEHVTRVLDVGVLDNGAPYMVMEFLAGVDLGQVLERDGTLSVSDAVEVVLQASEALAEAHSLGIVHRDLKPANLFATTRSDGSRLVKVLDFGISKAANVGGPEPVHNLTASGMVMGSPRYMSPEQVRSAKGVDARSDIWSLGVILYEFLAGVPPFEGETMGDILVKIASEKPESLGVRRPDLPTGLVSIIEQCLERNVEARIQNVGELAQKLLPFAPKEAAISAQRILRMYGNAGDAAIASNDGFVASPGATIATPSPTERAWLRSGAVAPLPSRRGLRYAMGAAIVVSALAVVGASALIAQRTLRPRHAEESPAPIPIPVPIPVPVPVPASAPAPPAPAPAPTPASASASAEPSSHLTLTPPSRVRPPPAPARTEPRTLAPPAASGSNVYDHF